MGATPALSKGKARHTEPCFPTRDINSCTCYTLAQLQFIAAHLNLSMLCRALGIRMPAVRALRTAPRWRLCSKRGAAVESRGDLVSVVQVLANLHCCLELLRQGTHTCHTAAHQATRNKFCNRPCALLKSCILLLSASDEYLAQNQENGRGRGTRSANTAADP
jgi:hypothetical protein